MRNQIFYRKLLNVDQPMEISPLRFSTIALLLIGARKLSGRNINSGTYSQNEIDQENLEDNIYYPFLLNGLVNYLIFLEQIGCLFKSETKKTKKKNGIYLALFYFTDLSEDKINAIRALRNSLAHNYGLTTDKKSKFKFTLSFDRNNDIIIMPTQDWSGDYNDKSQQTSVKIFVIDLINLIEHIYSKILEHIEKDNIISILDMNEIKARFTILT